MGNHERPPLYRRKTSLLDERALGLLLGDRYLYGVPIPACMDSTVPASLHSYKALVFLYTGTARSPPPLLACRPHPNPTLGGSTDINGLHPLSTYHVTIS